MGSSAPFIFGRFHKQCDHDFHMGRFGRCPYCDAGSVPVERSLIVEAVNK